MKIEVYIKGNFSARYKGNSSGSNPDLSRIYHDIEFTEKWLTDAEEISAYEPKVLTKEPYQHLANLSDVLISMKSSKEYIFFQEDFSNVVINELEIVKPVSFGKTGEIKGVFYGTYVLYKPDPPPIIETPRIVTDKVNIDSKVVLAEEVNQVIVKESDKKEDIFNKPWEPDEFLRNYNVSRSSWDGWMDRWKKNGFALLALIFGMILTLKLGLLSIPFLWIPFLIGLKVAGDIILRIFAPKFEARQIASLKTNSNFRSFLRIIYFIILFFVLLVFIYKKLYVFAAIAFALLIFHLFTYRSPLLFFLRRFFHAISLILIGFALIRLLNFIGGDRPIPVVKNDEDEELIPDKPDSLKKENQYTMSWYDYRKNLHKGTFRIPEINFKNSYSNRISQSPNNGFDQIYSNCYALDKTLLPGLISMFDSIKKQKKPNSKEFAEIIGTFIQRIPYVLVHDKTCEELMSSAQSDEFIQQYHSEGKECFQNCRFGVQAPAEFGFNLKGDCDTRALLAFTILDHYGYDVAILISEVYGHAILGIGLPYSGLYKSSYGVQYYAWELTAKDWQPGLLPPQVGNMYNWKISITNKK
ncbi:MAG: hypothetical protein ACK5AY_01075 [Bacteroidota bacterium]